ncbi:MAG TPA: Obg family GTPase CgtA, partial [Actinomycetota bacterium]|nr:Obg family GTPase CgtA [Actinomycetota bacterium]
PNAGKSTLLAALTAARPKVADYPFTTLSPNLGVAEDEDARYVLADVPGLIEGAHEGRGLGHRFLRHVSRCGGLAYVVDLSAEDPAADLRVIRAEVEAFDPAMRTRPSIVIGTKADLVDEGLLAERAAALGPGSVVVSAVAGRGLDELAASLARLATRGAEAVPREPYVVLRPARESFSVRREGGRFRVVGPSVERWVAEADLDDEASVARLQKRLKRGGVERRLAEEGARPGDEVLIAGRAFEFHPDEEDG